MPQLAKIIKTRVLLRKGKVEALVLIRSYNSATELAVLDEQSIACILPRDILAGPKKKVSFRILKSMNVILERLVNNRIVRVVPHKGLKKIRFLSWKNVQFLRNE